MLFPGRRELVFVDVVAIAKSFVGSAAMSMLVLP